MIRKPLIVSTVRAICPACEGSPLICGACSGTGQSRVHPAFICCVCGGGGVAICTECAGSGEVDFDQPDLSDWDMAMRHPHRGER